MAINSARASTKRVSVAHLGRLDAEVLGDAAQGAELHAQCTAAGPVRSFSLQNEIFSGIFVFLFSLKSIRFFEKITRKFVDLQVHSCSVLHCAGP